VIAPVASVEYVPPAALLAPEVLVAKQDEGGSISVEPFLWFVSLDSRGSADGSPPANVALGPSDVFGALDAGFLLAFEARFAPRWNVLADGLYVRFEEDEGSVRTETEATMVEAGVARRLESNAGIDLLAGLRYIDLSLDVEIGSAIDSTARESWIDPWIGARGRIALGEQWSLRLRGDVGGFGVGSEFTWQALAVLGWSFADSWQLDLGYRAIDIDYEGDDLEFDGVIYGPLLGLAWHG
jgi:hypothetical protein